uniref:EamA-like transporter family protein n=1 Tax=Candidatus Kentrum sp. FW TaxID=2126338 RepID=A0A450SXA9_9GAMM|nr:MAG: EamA-like transporter family protein [Candidatus Kentron sp. FW]
MHRYIDYSYIFATIGLTVYGQLMVKWRIATFGPLPADMLEKLKFLILLLFDPFIFSGVLAGLLAALAWIAAMTKFDLNHAYPFMSLNFVLILLLSVWLLGEPLTLKKALGVGLIVMGTVVATHG